MRMFAQRLKREGVPASRIIMVNFEELENASLRNADVLHKFIVGKLTKGKKSYVFLDEIQRVEHYEEVLDSLYVKKGVDLYVTGSTADLFSSEIATLLTGRYVEGQREVSVTTADGVEGEVQSIVAFIRQGGA